MQIVAVNPLNRAKSYNLYISEIQYGGWPPYWKLKIRYISATVHPITTKFCKDMEIEVANNTEVVLRIDSRPIMCFVFGIHVYFKLFLNFMHRERDRV